MDNDSVLRLLPLSLGATIGTAKLCEVFDVSRATIGDWSGRGVIPPPLPLRSRIRRWDTEAVREHLRKS